MGEALQQTTLKEKMERLIHSLPEEASIEEAMEKLYLLYKIEKGIQQADTGKTVSHEEAKKHLDEWLDWSGLFKHLMISKQSADS